MLTRTIKQVPKRIQRIAVETEKDQEKKRKDVIQKEKYFNLSFRLFFKV